MGYAYQITAIAGMFSLIVFSHELGHFVMARAAGVKVKRFSIGFGPALYRKNVNETEFVIALIPLGGFVELLGEDPSENVSKEDVARSFRHQPVAIRAIIVLAGALFNILLAVVLLTAVYWSGISVLAPEIGSITKGSPAEIAGLLPGDRILEIQGINVRIYEDAIRVIQENPGVSLFIKVQRADKVIQTVAKPEKRVGYDALNRPSDTGFLGIGPKGTKTVYRANIMEASTIALNKAWEMTGLVSSAFLMLLKWQLPLSDLGGPIMIVRAAGNQLDIGLQHFIFTAAFLSVNIGVFNLMPLPALDGGLIILLFIEVARGKPMKANTMLLIQRVGVVSLILMVIFVFYSDIMRLTQ